MPLRGAALTLAGGRYHQLVLGRSLRVSGPGKEDVADSLGIPTVPVVASANHLTLALDQELTRDLRLGLEGYFKRFEDLPDPEQVGTYASGVDVWVRRGEGVVSGWMGYSLAWYWSRPDSAGASAHFNGRQLLSTGLAAQGKPGRVELRVAYGSGLPYSSVGPLSDLGSATGGAPADADLPTPGSVPQDFLRLDAQVSRTFTPRINGHDTLLTPYLRVINALNRRDALYYRWSPRDDPSAKPVATLPLLPVLGVEWKL
jgi:hypothetical protein